MSCNCLSRYLTLPYIPLILRRIFKLRETINQFTDADRTRNAGTSITPPTVCV